MKKLFYSVSSLEYPHAGVLVNQMMSDLDKGINVVMAYCDRALPSCMANIHGNLGICKVCRHQHKQLINAHLAGITVLPLRPQIATGVPIVFEYDDISDLKKLVYRDVHVGLSIISYYVTITRKPSGKVSDTQRTYFDTLLSQLCRFVDEVNILLDQQAPDVVSIYNGRMFENRLFYEIALLKGIKFESVEITGGWFKPMGRILYEGGLPLDICLMTKMVNQVWEHSRRSEEEKRKIGASFYENRRNGRLTNDVVYIGAQKRNLLPEDYDPNKKNIVFFNSSEDELFSLGGDWDEDNLFVSQLDAIKFLLANTPANVHIYLRIHPNLKHVNAAYHTDLYTVKSDKLTVIPPDSPISSYALMDIADQVVVMGSTMGAESCFWGKPVINLRKSEYFYLGAGYCPKTREELINLLNSDLLAKEKDGVLRYGFYYMAIDERILTDDHIPFNRVTSSLLGMKVCNVIPYLKLWGSNALFHVAYPRFVAYFSRFFKNSTPFPGA